MSGTTVDLNWIFGTAQDDDLKGTVGSETTDIFFGFGGDDKFVGFGETTISLADGVTIPC